MLRPIRIGASGTFRYFLIGGQGGGGGCYQMWAFVSDADDIMGPYSPTGHGKRFRMSGFADSVLGSDHFSPGLPGAVPPRAAPCRVTMPNAPLFGAVMLVSGSLVPALRG